MSLGLKLEKSLLTSSIRCIVQLTIMVRIFIRWNTKNPANNKQIDTGKNTGEYIQRKEPDSSDADDM